MCLGVPLSRTVASWVALVLARVAVVATEDSIAAIASVDYTSTGPSETDFPPPAKTDEAYRLQIIFLVLSDRI